MSGFSLLGSEDMFSSIRVGKGFFVITTSGSVYMTIEDKTSSYTFANKNGDRVMYDNIRIEYTTASGAEGDHDRYYISCPIKRFDYSDYIDVSVRCVYIDPTTDNLVIEDILNKIKNENEIDPEIDNISGKDVRISVYDNTLIAIDADANIYQYRPEAYPGTRTIVFAGNSGGKQVSSHTIYTTGGNSYLVWSERSRLLNYINLTSVLDNYSTFLQYDDPGVVSTISGVLVPDAGENPNYVTARVMSVGTELYAWIGYGMSASAPLKYKIFKLNGAIDGAWTQVGNTINPGYVSLPNTQFGIFSIKTIIEVNGQLFILGDNSRLFKLSNNIWSMVALNGDGKFDNVILIGGYKYENNYIVANNTLYLTAVTVYGEESTRRDLVYYNAAANELRFIRYSAPANYHTCGKYLVGSTMYAAVGSDTFPTSTVDSKLGLYKIKANNTLDETKNYATGYILREGSFFDGRIYADAAIYNMDPVTGISYGTVSIPLYSTESITTVLNSAASDAVKPQLFKDFLRTSPAPTAFVFDNVDASSLFGKLDISPDVATRYTNAKVTAVGAPDLNLVAGVKRIVEFTKAQLSNLFVIPFDSGHFTLRVTGDRDYDVLFNVNNAPYLTIDGVGIPIGSSAIIAGIEMIFLTRGSIWLDPAPASPSGNNTFPARLQNLCALGRIILFSSETIAAAASGGTLPANQGTYVGVAGDCFRDLGAQVNLYTMVNGVPMVEYVFRRAQLIKGAASEGVGGSSADGYVSGYLCTWAAAGAPPNSL